MQEQRTPSKRSTPGIRQRHAKDCRRREGKRCSCSPSYDAWVWDPRAERKDGKKGKKLYKTFRSLAEAKAWREESSTGVRKGTMRAPTKTTVRAAGDALIEDMKSGAARKKKGARFKPSTIRGYEQTLRDRVYPDLGGIALGKVERRDVQRLVDRLLAEGLEAGSVKNAVMPLRVLFRRAIQDGDVSVNPCDDLRLPDDSEERDVRDRRAITPAQGAVLLAALRESDRAVWATALYAGLRRGELQALKWEHVDLAAGLIHVRRSWDEREARDLRPKSKKSRRGVPIVGLLRDYLVQHKLLTGRSEGFVFGRSADLPFIASNLRARSVTDWKGLDGIMLHEARHTAITWWIEAGWNPKAVSAYAGHSSIQVTFDIYGHLLPGNETQAVAKFDAYLGAADTASRLAQLEAVA